MINDKTFPLKHVTTEQIGKVSALANQLHGDWTFNQIDNEREGFCTHNVHTGSGNFSIDYTPVKSWYVVTEQSREEQSRHIARFVAEADPNFVMSLILEIERLHDFERKAAEWKNNHDNQVEIARVLKERTDMPLERVHAYNKMKELEAENKRLKDENESLASNKVIQMHTEMINYRMLDVDQKMNMLIGKFDQHFR